MPSVTAFYAQNAVVFAISVIIMKMQTVWYVLLDISGMISLKLVKNVTTTVKLALESHLSNASPAKLDILSIKMLRSIKIKHVLPALKTVTTAPTALSAQPVSSDSLSPQMELVSSALLIAACVIRSKSPNVWAAEQDFSSS
jgi:hypothetical protein